MPILGKKYRWQNILHSYVTLTLLVLFCIGLGLSVFDRYTIEREMAERRQEKETELWSLKERKTALEEKVEYLKHDEGVEAEIRQHFDVAKEGEKVVVLIESERQESDSATSTEPKPDSFWDRFLPW